MKHFVKSGIARLFYFSVLSFANCFIACAHENSMANHELGARGLDPRTGVILNEKEAPRVLEQCSRSTPKAERFWKPTEEEVNKFDQKIIMYLQQSHVRKPTQSLEDYNRQYIGIWTLDKKYIYVNFYYRPVAEELGMPIIKAVSICAGGDYFFGMVYNVAENTIQELRYNSDAG